MQINNVTKEEDGTWLLNSTTVLTDDEAGASTFVVHAAAITVGEPVVLADPEGPRIGQVHSLTQAEGIGLMRNELVVATIHLM
jgi:hypothetical protein